MKLTTGLLTAALVGLAPLSLSVASTAPAAPALSETIYDGLRASRLIESHVFSREGRYLGRVRNLAMRDGGMIEALILERDRTGTTRDAVFRVPWDRIVKPSHPGILIAGVTDYQAPELNLFPPEKGAESFLMSEVLGEYARLQAGQGYGYVKDAVFSVDGKLIAILIARDPGAGGGTFAFAYPGRTGMWSPNMSYYGLPFVTAEQASESGLRVAPEKFTMGSE